MGQAGYLTRQTNCLTEQKISDRGQKDICSLSVFLRFSVFRDYFKTVKINHILI